MGSTTVVYLFVPGIILGVIAGFLLSKVVFKKKFEKERDKYQDEIEKAQKTTHKILSDAQSEAFKIRQQAQTEQQEKHNELRRMEERLMKKEDVVEKKIEDLDKSKQELDNKIVKVREVKLEVEKIHSKQAEELEKISNLSKESAREILFKKVEEQSKEEILKHIERLENDMKKEVDDKARLLLAETIQKYSAEVAAETTMTTVQLESDDLKGRIIGREGRNINAFERITGVDVIVDDTPGSIVISCFDPIRRYVAKIALEQLISDGRIHPAKIEETVDKIKKDTLILIKELGEKAVFDTGVSGLPPNLVKLLGRLKFRSSYGQNALKHSMEVAFIAEGLAEAIGANSDIAKKAGLLHDLGKAVDHEIKGNHSQIGADILKKFGLSKEVVHAVAAHHGNIKPETTEAYLVMAANEISNHRPGAQKDTLEMFIKRLSEFETLAKSFDGIKNAFAIQSGRKLRVFVNPEEMDDLQAKKLSYEIARKIESETDYAGVVEVHAIRESRREAYAV
ncbi:ribonuclease Y [Candidatus Peregrinibacteria bacterium RIFOXYB2_FULL_32_7]|nr:MAG: ribonuclease Y [Candidatus Peregrinibacteria bacterium RIFOXYB2_FULL_32_7]